MNGDVDDFMEQLNASHTVGLDDITMSMPYSQETTRIVERVEEVKDLDGPDTQTLKKRSKSCNYNSKEDKSVCEVWINISLDATVGAGQTNE